MKSVQRAWYWTLQWGLKFIFALFYGVRVYGRENVPAEGGCLILSNHQSYLDPPLIGVGLRRQLWYVARDSLFYNKAFGWLLNSINAIPIKRNTADISGMKAIIEKLKEGHVVVLFPEATRSLTGKIADTKAGFGLLARRARVPVVPAIVDGAFESWPRTQKLPSPGKIIVNYGNLISAERIKELGDEEFAKELTRILRSMQKEVRTKAGRVPWEYDQPAL